MKLLRCRDIGVDCGFVARGSSDNDVVEGVAAHAKAVHGLSASDESTQSWRKAIQDIEPEDNWTLA